MLILCWGELREAPNFSIHGEGTPSNSSSAPASSSESFGVSSDPTRTSTTPPTTSMIIVSQEFFQNLLDGQSATDCQLQIIKTKMTNLYG